MPAPTTWRGVATIMATQSGALEFGDEVAVFFLRRLAHVHSRMAGLAARALGFCSLGYWCPCRRVDHS